MTTQTIQYMQANIQKILDQLDAGTLSEMQLVDHDGGSVVAKLLPWATYNGAAVSGTDDVVRVPQQKVQNGPMNIHFDGLYAITKQAHNANLVQPFTLTGTVTVTNGDAVVTGVGTAFTTQLTNGAKVKFSNQQGTTYTVLTVDSATQITLTAVFTGATLAGVTVQRGGTDKFQVYAIYRVTVPTKQQTTVVDVTPRAALISKTHATFLGL